MNEGIIQIYCGDGHGKSAAALGQAIHAASLGKNVIIIKFLKSQEDSEFMTRLEPEIKVFRFEKSEVNFEELSESEKQEEVQNIRNGLNFAKKVLTTGGCDILILDEVLGLLDNHIIEADELRAILEAKTEEETIILTGIQLHDETCIVADEIYKIEPMNFRVF
ncbi:MAG: cob(I)yrinic acid a,c-diamide adenosyltransferase [Lachnospiraceae bacterium]|nr:cob(I)yrinic acid a,c-diamide adenosyltransferase [Lachnospiraceae bacterium]